MRLVGRVLVVLEIAWLLTWFGISTWYEADGALDETYRINERNVLFHYATVAGVVYILRHHFEVQPLHWLAGIPFLFALLADVNNLIFACINLTHIHYGAWIAYMVLSCWAVASTTCAGVWFLYLKLK